MKKTNLLAKYGIRNTLPRRTVFDFIAAFGKRHFSVFDIMHYLKRRKSKIARASVYRTVKLFSRKGLLRTIDLGKGFYMYELAYDSSHHDHIFCVTCGKIIEFEEETIERLQKKVCRKNRFSPISHTLRIAGLCKACKSRSVQ